MKVRAKVWALARTQLAMTARLSMSQEGCQGVVVKAVEAVEAVA